MSHAASPFVVVIPGESAWRCFLRVVTSKGRPLLESEPSQTRICHLREILKPYNHANSTVQAASSACAVVKLEALCNAVSAVELRSSLIRTLASLAQLDTRLRIKIVPFAGVYVHTTFFVKAVFVWRIPRIPVYTQLGDNEYSAHLFTATNRVHARRMDHANTAPVC